MSLKLRLSLLIAGLLSGAVAVFSVSLVWSERRALLEEASARERAAAAALAEVCRGAVVGEQDVPLTNFLLHLKDDPEVREAVCVDSAGRVLGHTDMARLQSVEPSPPRPGPAPAVRREGDADVAEAAVSLGDRAVGAARVSFSRAAVEARVERGLAAARRRILRVSVFVVALGFAAAFLVTLWAVRPVKLLVDGARAIGGGRLDHRIPLDRTDELGVLSREFNRMGEKLAELDRLKQDFVSGITHDLKSPLTTVKAAVDVLESGKASPADAAGNLTLIRESADRLTDLITDVLQVAHIESGLALHRRPVNLEDVAHRVVRALEPVARRKGLSLDVLLDADLPTIDADESRVERALHNLVGNAVKFTEKGGVTVELGAAPGGQELRVRDTGPGIPPELAGRLFAKFSRAREAGKRTEGSGLGLSIAKGIAEAHGGTISVETVPGTGTTFTLRLPA